MRSNDYRIEFLRNQYEQAFNDGEQLRANGSKRKAAHQYEQAALALSKLAEETGNDRSADVENLQQAARLLRQGEDLDGHFEQDVPDSQGGDQPPDASNRSPAERAEGQSDDDIRRRIETFISETDTTWDDIGGLEDVITQLKRSIALGAVQNTPPAVAASDRLLLFGPPGTGKTLLASAVAGSLDATFFQIELGNLLSKYYGESPKQISALFDVAEDLAPSVIFLDEVDSLTTSRSDDMDGTSRRVLDTLLAELDGIDKSSDEFVLVLASTNTPWDLDSAIRSRFPRRIHIPLPDVTAATEIVRIHTTDGGVEFGGSPARYAQGTHAPEEATVPEVIARECVDRGFTGRDVQALCRTAVARMVYRENPNLEMLVDESVDRLLDHDLSLAPLTPADVRAAFDHTTASLQATDLEGYRDWDDQYGSQGLDTA